MRTERERISVMIVEDSATVREYLVGLFSSRPGLAVAATARNGKRALEVLRSIPRPDIITMDIHMPVMGGLEAIKAIMESTPVPILVVSAGPDATHDSMVFKAMEAGAVGAVRLPPGPASPDHEAAQLRLLESVQVLSEVRVVKRWPAVSPSLQPVVRRLPAWRSSPAPDPSTEAPREAHPPAKATAGPRAAPSAVSLAGAPPSTHQLLAIGASTGGPMAIKELLRALGPRFPLPVVIVQHMAEGFLQGFSEWLREGLDMRVELGRDGMPLEPGCILVAPDHQHLEVTSFRNVRLIPAGTDELHAPSVARLFGSVERAYGPTAIAALLTGMGRDGAVELARLKAAGAMTFAQDEATSVVHGMPGEAIRLGGARLVLPPAAIGAAIERMTKR
jgi:two-component system chemotaxis response regulator CheB